MAQNNTPRRVVVVVAAVLWLGCVSSQVGAQHPAVIDGAFTSPEEWRDAVRCRDSEDVGWVYIKQVADHPEPGIFALQVCHYFSEYKSLESYDANALRVEDVGGNPVETFVFMYGDCPPGEEYDKKWVDMVGLGDSAFYREFDEAGNPIYSIDDDGGFLVRSNDVGDADRRWWPGDPRPGEEGWDYGEYYWAFAAGGFNTSAFTHGYDDRLPDDDPAALRREIYEWEFFATERFDLSSPSDGDPLDMNDWKQSSDFGDPSRWPDPMVDRDWAAYLVWVSMMGNCRMPD